MWAEFKWDMSHPRELHAAVWAGIRGRNPDLSPEMRAVAFGMVVIGVSNVVMGVAALVYG